MSWKASCKIPRGASLTVAYDLIRDAQPEVAAACPALLAAAKAAAQDILETGTPDLKKHSFEVTFEGHTNAARAPLQHRQNEFISIAIRQID